MTPQIPLELAQARIARDEAWRLYDIAIDTESKEMIYERFQVCRYLEARCSELYADWQKLGGKSDVDTLTAVELASKLEIGQIPQRPTYDELIHGAAFTPSHRAEVQQKWREDHTDEKMQEYLEGLRNG